MVEGGHDTAGDRATDERPDRGTNERDDADAGAGRRAGARGRHILGIGIMGDRRGRRVVRQPRADIERWRRCRQLPPALGLILIHGTFRHRTSRETSVTYSRFNERQHLALFKVSSHI
jgi:hypothetical protein